MELAPLYYLGNLPSSEGRDLLMELRQSLLPPEEVQERGPEGVYDTRHIEEHLDRTGDPRNQDSTELCVIQWQEWCGQPKAEPREENLRERTWMHYAG